MDSSTRYMPCTESLTSDSPRSAVLVTTRARSPVSPALRRTASMPSSTEVTNAAASPAKRASTSPLLATAERPSLMICTRSVVRSAKPSRVPSAEATCSMRTVISASAVVVSSAKAATWVSRSPATWSEAPIPWTEPSERSTAAPCLRAASSSDCDCSPTPLPVRWRLAVTRWTWKSARRSDRISRRTSSWLSPAVTWVARLPTASWAMTLARACWRERAQRNQVSQPPTVKPITLIAITTA